MTKCVANYSQTNKAVLAIYICSSKRRFSHPSLITRRSDLVLTCVRYYVFLSDESLLT